MLRRLTRMYQRGPAETNRVEPPYISILCSCSDRRGKEACSLWHATHTTSATPMLSKVAGHVSSSMVPLHCLHNTARVGTNCSITGSGIWYEIRRAVVHSFQVWCSLAADTQNYLPGTLRTRNLRHSDMQNFNDCLRTSAVYVLPAKNTRSRGDCCVHTNPLPQPFHPQLILYLRSTVRVVYEGTSSLPTAKSACRLSRGQIILLQNPMENSQNCCHNPDVSKDSPKVCASVACRAKVAVLFFFELPRV